MKDVRHGHLYLAKKKVLSQKKISLTYEKNLKLLFFCPPVIKESFIKSFKEMNVNIQFHDTDGSSNEGEKDKRIGGPTRVTMTRTRKTDSDSNEEEKSQIIKDDFDYFVDEEVRMK